MHDTRPVEPAAWTGSGDVLRLLTCGSVDDGKSTLIGRLLYDSQAVFEDQLRSLERDSRRYGTTGEDHDLALLLDGLQAEREQGITIDVAYRFFRSDRRTFIIADTPGHEQYTRNMATGASQADAAVILVDARKGVLSQTRRHTFICHLMGIRHIVLAVNKIDLVDYSHDIYQRIGDDYRRITDTMDFATVVPIPVSARFGENVVHRGRLTPWYAGPTVIERLEAIPAATAADDLPFRMPVQWVNRPHPDFRGLAGTILAGQVAVGDDVVVAASGQPARVDRIVTADRDRTAARAGEAVTVLLDTNVDVARGDVLAAARDRPEVSRLLSADIVWMSDQPLLPSRPYLMRIGSTYTQASIVRIKHEVDIDTLDRRPARQLGLNAIGRCELSTATPIAFEPYVRNRDLGSFILIDRFNNQTVGAGMIRFGLRRAQNIHAQAGLVGKARRAAMKQQKARVIWMTGLSGAGKSTIARQVDLHLTEHGLHSYLLDGDNVRHGLNQDLGFTDADRVENIRRVGEVAKLFVDAGLIVICAFISPFRSERRLVRELLGADEFVEVFVDAPLDVCRRRDPKGLYKKALAGQIANFTGIDSAYEPPETPELTLRTDQLTVQEATDRILGLILRA